MKPSAVVAEDGEVRSWIYGAVDDDQPPSSPSLLLSPHYLFGAAAVPKPGPLPLLSVSPLDAMFASTTQCYSADDD
jgi:hypothetical protein